MRQELSLTGDGGHLLVTGQPSRSAQV